MVDFSLSLGKRTASLSRETTKYSKSICHICTIFCLKSTITSRLQVSLTISLMMTTSGIFVGNVQHLEKESQILDVIRVVIVVNVEPKNSV